MAVERREHARVQSCDASFGSRDQATTTFSTVLKRLEPEGMYGMEMRVLTMTGRTNAARPTVDHRLTRNAMMWLSSADP
jgi:hypothetical protein